MDEQRAAFSVPDLDVGTYVPQLSGNGYNNFLDLTPGMKLRRNVKLAG
jgi:hypothetical protein